MTIRTGLMAGLICSPLPESYIRQQLQKLD